MKVLKQILFAVAITICFSLTASAQKQDPDKKPPEKKNRPEIDVVPKEDKNKPKDEKKDDNNNRDNGKRKPQFAYSDTSQRGIMIV